MYSVGEVAKQFGITVRTLHHYDEIGLLSPTDRPTNGYRQYTQSDLDQLATIVLYRRLDISLAVIADLLAGGDQVVALQKQRELLEGGITTSGHLIAAIDTKLENLMNDVPLSESDRRELFGAQFDEYAEEAKDRWGESDAYKQSVHKTAKYSKQDWIEIKAEGAAIEDQYRAALESGLTPESEAAMDAAEAHRQHMAFRYYDLTHDAHSALADMYTADERFRKHYDDQATGLAEYVRSAIHANGTRHRT